MAVKKKAKKKLKSKSKSKPQTKAKKKAVKKRSSAKKTVRAKVVKKKTAVKKKPGAHKPAAKQKQPAAKPAMASAVPAGEVRLGTITHYYSHLMVAVVKVEAGMLREGDTIHVKGHTSDFRQRAGSLELDHVHVPAARVGESVGLKVVDHAREHDVVYLVSAP